VDAGVTGGADRYQPLRLVPPRMAIMDVEVAPRFPCPADTAAAPVAFEHVIALAAEASP
jgi:hypothetical protein